MDDNDRLLKTSDDEPSQGCSDYKDGYCKSTGKMCDTCYEDSLKMFKNNEV